MQFDKFGSSDSINLISLREKLIIELMMENGYHIPVWEQVPGGQLESQ